MQENAPTRRANIPHSPRNLVPVSAPTCPISRDGYRLRFFRAPHLSVYGGGLLTDSWPLLVTQRLWSECMYSCGVSEGDP